MNIMRQRLICILLITTALLVSCNTRNGGQNFEKNKELDELIEGTWYPFSPNDSIWYADTVWSLFGVVTFHTSEHRYHIYNGCNHTSGNFYYEGNGIIFDDAPSTLIGCPCEGRGGIHNGTIKAITIDGVKGIVLGEDVFPVTLMRAGKWMLEGKWELMEINGRDVEEDDIFVTFDNKSNTVVINGSESTTRLSFANDKDTEISFNVQDSKSKDNSQPVNDLIDALTSVVSYDPSSRNGGCSVNIILQDSAGYNVVTLQRDSERLREMKRREEKTIDNRFK